MTDSAETQGPPVGTAPFARPDRGASVARDRVLLYTRGMDVEPVLSVDIALRALRRAGPDAGTAEVMAGLGELLREKGVHLRMEDAEGRRLTSVPPMNRCAMVAEELDRHPLWSACKRLACRLRGKGRPR